MPRGFDKTRRGRGCAPGGRSRALWRAIAALAAAAPQTAGVDQRPAPSRPCGRAREPSPRGPAPAPPTCAPAAAPGTRPSASAPSAAPLRARGPAPAAPPPPGTGCGPLGVEGTRQAGGRGGCGGLGAGWALQCGWGGLRGWDFRGGRGWARASRADAARDLSRSGARAGSKRGRPQNKNRPPGPHLEEAQAVHPLQGLKSRRALHLRRGAPPLRGGLEPRPAQQLPWGAGWFREGRADGVV